MNLSKCPLRLRARITHVEVDEKFDLRMRELGIRPGAEVAAVNRAAFGGIVVNVAGTRIAVDHRSAKRILVEPVESPSAPSPISIDVHVPARAAL